MEIIDTIILDAYNENGCNTPYLHPKQKKALFHVSACFFCFFQGVFSIIAICKCCRFHEILLSEISVRIREENKRIKVKQFTECENPVLVYFSMQLETFATKKKKKKKKEVLI